MAKKGVAQQHLYCTKTKRKALYSERFYLNSGSTDPTTIAVIESATKRRALGK